MQIIFDFIYLEIYVTRKKCGSLVTKVQALQNLIINLFLNLAINYSKKENNS